MNAQRVIFGATRIVALATLYCAYMPATSVANEPLTVEQLYQTVSETQTRIQSLYYEAEVTGRSAFRGLSNLQRFHVIAGFKKDYRFAEIGHYSRCLSWNEDLDWVRHYLTPGHLDVVWPLNRYAESSDLQAKLEVNPKLDPIVHEFYLECTGWWPSGEIVNPQFGIYPLLKVLGSPECKVSLGPLLEGVPHCAVIELSRPRQRVWLDMDRGGILVRRELDLGKGTYAIYTNTDFRENAPGVWLPWKVHRVMKRSESEGWPTDHGEGDVLSDTTRTLIALKVNSVSDEFFRYRAGSGTFVRDLDLKKLRLLPGGLDLLDQQVALAEKLIRCTSAPLTGANSGSTTPTRIVSSLHLMAGAALVALSVLFVGLRSPFSRVGFGVGHGSRARPGRVR